MQTTNSGGIYIEILGDYSKFEKDLRVARREAVFASSEISKALGVRIDNKSVTDFTRTLMKAQAAGKAMNADFRSPAMSVAITRITRT